MKCRIGFLVSGLGISQFAYHLLDQCRKHLGGDDPDPDLDVIVFYQNAVKTWKIPNFAMMNISEAYGFDGVVVATDVATAEKLSAMPGPSRRFFYAWDLEWTIRGDDDPPCEYERLSAVYRNPAIPLVARSVSHADAIERCWNTRVSGVCERCDLRVLKGLVHP